MELKGKVNVTGTGIKTSMRNGNTVVACVSGKIIDFQVNGVSFLVLPDNDAKNAYLIGKGSDEKLVISKALVLDNDEQISLVSNNHENIDFAIYPAIGSVMSDEGTVNKSKSVLKSISQWRVSVPKADTGIKLLQADDSHFILKAASLDLSKVNDLFITFDYRGDRGVCMMNGDLITDNFYTSKPWIIGLKQFQQALKTSDMYFYFTPMFKDAPYLSYLDKEVLPDFSNKKSFLEIKQPLISVEYKVNVVLSNR